MLDDTNFVAVEATSPKNRGEPILSALRELKADESKAERIGKRAQHLVFEVLHPDNIDRSFLLTEVILPRRPLCSPLYTWHHLPDENNIQNGLSLSCVPLDCDSHPTVS